MSKQVTQQKFHSLKPIMSKAPNAKYYMFFGERSNGKTHSVQDYGIQNYFKTGAQMAIVRRWQEDFKGKRAASYFDSMVSDAFGVNKIKKYSKGKFDHVIYYSGRWYMAYYDETLNKDIMDTKPFAYAFALTNMEHEKGNSYPGLKNGLIFFDEFMSRGIYVPDEFMLFMQTISTLVRGVDNIKIFMAANSIDMIGCPYIKEMGLTNFRNMKPGDIDIYNYGQSNKLQVAVEYCDSTPGGKDSDVYFAFNNPRLKMITSGVSDFDIYPHLTTRYEKKDVIFSYFIKYDDIMLQADVIQKDNDAYTFIHRKTTNIKHENRDIVFSTEASSMNNYAGKLTKPINKAVRKLFWFFVANKVFYATNEIGECVAKYLNWCNTSK